MKIHQMLHFPLEGAGTGIYVDNLAKSLLKKGHVVRVLCSAHYPPSRDYPVDAVLFSNGENETFDLGFDFPVFASHPLSKGARFGELDKNQREAYLRTFHDRIERTISLFDPDIIHVHHGWVIASILADLDTPYVVTLHGTEYYGFKSYREYQENTLRGLHGAQIIMALTEQERQQAISTYRIDPEKVVIVRSGTDTDKFRPIDVDKTDLLGSYSVKEVDRPVVFFGGRLTAQKGVDTLLKAAEIYSQADEKPITLIAGDGDLRQQLQDLAGQLKLDSVYFLGNQSHEQMVKLFNMADLAALPSEFEAFGLVALEALACGTPVIAGDVGGLSQIVNEQVGCLIKPGDYRTLAEKVATFIKDGFKQKVRDKAAAYIRENFSWQKTADNIEKIYERVSGCYKDNKRN